MKQGDQIIMAPSGVQKERMHPEDMFVLDSQGNIVHAPECKPPPHKPPKLSECSPLFMAAYELRNAGAVMHSHSLNAVLATLLDPDSNEFRVTHLEMMKGIEGHGYYGNCIVPIIENTARECELTDRLRQAIVDYPTSNAVLVRRHGVYIWGKDWIHAKTQAECYDYLFEAAVKMQGLGIDCRRPPPPRLPKQENGAAHSNGVSEPEAQPETKRVRRRQPLPTAVVLDIEGTVAPISYVANVMFPYANTHLREHLEHTKDSPETQEDIELIRKQAQEDVAAGLPGAIPLKEGSQQELLASAAAWALAASAADRKVTALKTLQGHVWRRAFSSGALRAELFRDVPDALQRWRDAGVKTYIYSSGSREAQRLFFGYSTAGDLRPYLCGFFDTTSGAKQEEKSYRNIALALGVDATETQQVLFATDMLGEAEAARKAGWNAVLVTRPGNPPLPEGHGFRLVSSLDQLLEV